MAMPLRGLTWASYPEGISINKPVGTSTLSIGFSVSGSVILALMSIPDAPAVAYCGRSLEEVFTILISTGGMGAKIGL